MGLILLRAVRSAGRFKRWGEGGDNLCPCASRISTLIIESSLGSPALAVQLTAVFQTAVQLDICYHSNSQFNVLSPEVNSSPAAIIQLSKLSDQRLQAR